MRVVVIILGLAVSTVGLYGQNDSISSQEERLGFGAVEYMPEYVGGFEALERYLNSTAIYTEEARESGVSGTVYMTFLVDSDGSIADPRILKGLSRDLDSVSIALIENMPKWIPAMQRGQRIAYPYNLPIAFALDPNQQGLSRPIPSKYWRKKGRKKYYDLCLHEFEKPGEECDCWYDFIIWNYNDKHLKDLDFEIIFDRQECNSER